MSLERALREAVQKYAGVATAVPIPDSAPEHLKLGIEGENEAAEYLSNLGYTLLARNVNYRFGELDIVAKNKDEIVFVEVRTRTVGYILPADRTVGNNKLKKLVRAARIWVDNNNYQGFWRIDLVAITVDKQGHHTIEHIKDITEGIE